MAASALSRTQQVILLCALALGVIAMHHVNAPGVVLDTMETITQHVSPAGEPTLEAVTESGADHHACTHCGGHLMLHVCLAVLCATSLLLLALLALFGLRRTSVALTTAGPRGSPRFTHPPGRSGRSTL